MVHTVDKSSSIRLHITQEGPTHLKRSVHILIILSSPSQIVFVEPSSQLDDLASRHGFDKSAVHVLTERSAGRELVMCLRPLNSISVSHL